MLWLFVVGLGVWILIQQSRLTDIQQRLGALEAAAKRRQSPVPTPEPAEAARATSTAAPRGARAARPREPETLRPSRKVSVVALAQEAAGVLPGSSAAGDAISAFAHGLSQELAAEQPRRAAAATRPAISLEAWLSEKGLAWIGGAALVVGGAFLVGFAVQSGFFNPLMRVVSAAVLGGLLIAGGEASRRGWLPGKDANRLVAAIASGAGASMLYGAAWAAHALYRFVDAGVCAAMLAAVAAGLLALALLNGEALALLAIAGAFVAPALTFNGGWGEASLSLYLGLLIAVGMAIAPVRGWKLTGWATLAGAGVWGLAAVFEPSILKALLLALEPLAVLAILTRFRREPKKLTWLGEGAVGVASCVSAFALAAAYNANHAGQADIWLNAGLAGVGLPLLTAVLVRSGGAVGLCMGGPALALALAAAAALLHIPPFPGKEWVWVIQAAVLVAGGVWAAWSLERKAATSGSAALGALALGVMTCLPLGSSAAAPLPCLLVCLMLAAGTAALVRWPHGGRDPLALEVWSAAAAAAFLSALIVGVDWRFGPVAFAGAAVVLAGVQRRLGWTSFAATAVSAAALAASALLAPALLRYALSGAFGAAWMLGSGVAVAAAATLGARLLRRRPTIDALAEALATIAPMAALAGAFVFLRWLTGARVGLPLNDLTEASVRTLLIGVAGLVAFVRLDAAAGMIARLRAHGLLFQVLEWNPWWGIGDHHVGGLVFLNTLAVAYLATALLFARVSWLAYARGPREGRLYFAVSALFGGLWVWLEIRRLTRGGDLSGGLLTIGPVEAAALAVAMLALPFGMRESSRRLQRPLPLAADDLAAADEVTRWSVICLAGFLLCLWSNPWWGPAARPFSGLIEALASWLGYGLSVILIALIALDARSLGRGRLQAAAETLAVVLGAVLATLLVRWAFHGDDLLPTGAAVAAETWTYSALWGLLGAALLAVGTVWGRTVARLGLGLLLLAAAKVFVFDTAHLSGAVRAGSFIVLGALLLIGALIARRGGLQRAAVPGG